MRLLAVVLAALALAPFAGGGKITGAGVRWVQHGLLTHPGDKGTWTMAGAIVDKGTFVGVCVKCQGATADLRVTYEGKRGTFVLLAWVRSLHERTRWTLLSGTGGYEGLHGLGTCVGRLIVNEVSFRDRCMGVVSH
jgi:hypothetical protein